MTTSFESRIAELLNEQATGEQPPARVSVGAAIRRGNSRLRWQRAGIASLAGAPALAASAVVAIALIGGISLGGHPAAGKPGTGRLGAASAPPVSQATRTGSLRVLYTDARFGWLPAGEKVTSGFESDKYALMNISGGKGNRVSEWSLEIYAGGMCAVHGSAKLVCQDGLYRLASRAVSINGHEAFWSMPRGHQTSWTGEHQEIIWEYAPGAWATFESPGCCSAMANRQPVQTLLRIAGRISFGPAGSEPIRFDFQLTDVPSFWRVSQLSYGAHDGSMLANFLQLTAPPHPRMQVNINVSPGGTGNAYYCGRLAKHSVLRGHDVETSTNPPPMEGEASDTYGLCANDVGGLAFDITTSDLASRAVTELFQHMRFLVPDPSADWVTNPISGRRRAYLSLQASR
jgi:hypothetical protein